MTREPRDANGRRESQGGITQDEPCVEHVYALSR